MGSGDLGTLFQFLITPYIVPLNILPSPPANELPDLT
jgi:hypothetical protein